MWIDPETAAIARTHSDIRNLRPNWSGPAVITDDMIAALGFVPVALVDPVFDPIYQGVAEAAPVLVNGIWTQQWQINQLDDAAALLNLQAARAAKTQEINDARAQANLSTFPHAGKLVACDALSRSDIDGVANNIALFGAFPADFPGAWKATDNTYIPMPTVDDFKAMYASMTGQGSQNFARAQALKMQLAGATTTAQITAITWSTPE